MSLLSILVVEDDEGVQSLLRRLLTQEGHQVTIVGNGQDAIRVAQEIPVHVLLTDLKLPDIDGLAVLERIFQIDSKVLGIVMTGYGSIDGAVKAMKLGAFDFLTKPFDNEAVALVINKAMETHRRRQDSRGPRKSARAPYRAEQLVGTSEPVQRCSWIWSRRTRPISSASPNISTFCARRSCRRCSLAGASASGRRLRLPARSPIPSP